MKNVLKTESNKQTEFTDVLNVPAYNIRSLVTLFLYN